MYPNKHINIGEFNIQYLYVSIRVQYYGGYSYKNRLKRVHTADNNYGNYFLV